MSFPASHKTVFVLDHSPDFSMPCDSIRFDTIKFCQPQQQQSYPVIPPVSKSLWSSASESVLEYCRVVWDIFPPDTDDQKLIRFVVSDKPHNNKSTHVLNQWDVAEQNCLLVSAGLASMGRPEPETRRAMAESKGYDISKGTETGLKILCETTAKQNQILKQGRPLLNRGRIVLITHFRDQHHLLKVLEAFRNDFREINEVAGQSEYLTPVDDVQLQIVHCVPPHYQETVNTQSWKSEISFPSNVEVKIFSVWAGAPLSKKMMSLALSHFELASTTVTGIPMKEEQNANSSANYDVELFHKASAAQLVEAGVQTQKDEYLTITLKWSTPRSTAADLHNCTNVSRVTPIDVNSRHSSCLTNFLLNDRSVMLEMPMSKRSGAKVLSHMLTSHAGEIFIHTLNISRTIVEDPPNIADAPGGRVTDYRITDLNDILSGNRLAPFYGECKTSAKTPSDPIEQAQEKLTRHTLSCPLTISTTTIFNMAVVEPLQKLIIQPELTEEHLAECRRVIYALFSMENKGEQLPIPLTHQKSRSTTKKDEYKIMFGELEQFLTLHCRTENHHKVLDCLLEVRNKPGDYPRPTPRNRPSANAGFQGESSSKMEKDRSIGGNVTSSGYGSYSGHPAKRMKSESLLDIWSRKVEKENSRTPFAGQQTFGEIAKLYLNIEKKEESKD